MKAQKQNIKSLNIEYPIKNKNDEKKNRKKEEKENNLLGRKLKRNFDKKTDNESSFPNKTMEDSEELQIKEPMENRNKLYVKFYKKINEEELLKIFKKYGKIKSINIKKRKKFGFIEFYDNKVVNSIINKRNEIYNNNQLFIDYMREKKAKNYEKYEFHEKQSKRKKIEEKEEEENDKEKEENIEEIIEIEDENDDKELIKNIEEENKKEKETIDEDKENNESKIRKTKNINIEDNNKKMEERISILEIMLIKMKKENEKYKEENEKYKEKNEKEKKEFLRLIGILSEINNQNEKYLKNNIEVRLNNLNIKLESISNAYKVLYIRKLANIFLNELYKRYSNSIEDMMIKINKKKHSFTRVIKDIKNINSEQINLIIDFLKHIKMKSSSIIHIQDKDIKIQRGDII